MYTGMLSKISWHKKLRILLINPCAIIDTAHRGPPLLSRLMIHRAQEIAEIRFRIGFTQ